MDNFIEYLYSKFLQSDGVSIDTRTIEPDNLFFALKGPNFNANRYAGEALDRGAAFAVVDEQEYANDPRIILAPDCLRALQDLAAFHRSRYKRKLIGITGSNGKTTTKELMTRVLGQKYIVHATKGNLNNHIGVPLTLLHIHPQVEVAIIEMGANKIGDIAELCGYANPDFGLITNIGEAHTEGFGGVEGILRGKSELFDHLKKNGGTPFINTGDPYLVNMARRFESPVLFPDEDLELVSADPMVRFRLGGVETETRLIGEYNFGNIAAAVSVGRHFGVPDPAIVEAVATYVPSNQRSQLIQRGNLQIIMDAYNANPSSVKVALDNLSKIKGRRSVLLADMKELAHSDRKHRELGAYIGEKGIEDIILLGKEMQYAHEVIGNSSWFENIEDLKTFLEGYSFGEGTLLIKGSRGMKLESVLDLIH